MVARIEEKRSVLYINGNMGDACRSFTCFGELANMCCVSSRVDKPIVGRVPWAEMYVVGQVGHPSPHVSAIIVLPIYAGDRIYAPPGCMMVPKPAANSVRVLVLAKSDGGIVLLARWP